MEALRSKGVSTRILILLHLVLERPKGQREVAERVGMTPQGISEYMRKMRAEGLVRSSDLRATVKGVQFLHHELLSLKGFVDRSIKRLEIVRSTDAIAAGDIVEGERVTLFMNEGLLYAGKGVKGSSTGVSRNACGKGDIVQVSDLDGVVDMVEGSVHLIEIQPAREGGGSAVIGKRQYKDLLDGSCRIAALDLEAAALLARSGIGYDLELPRPRTVMDTIKRGLTVVAFGTPHSVADMVRELDGSDPPVAWSRHCDGA